MTKTKPIQHTHIRPSSRDPITNWLDVFTKLLAVPPAEQIRIRDELEDHLRMRVDDLLILGMSEPEAVQKAVTELGETAELAKRFKEARTNTRRRFYMHTALFAVAGLALTMSVANIMPHAGSSNSAGNTHENSLVQPEQDSNATDVLNFDIAADKLEGVLSQIAEAAGARGFVHWGSLGLSGVDQDTAVGAIPSKGLEMSKVRELLNSVLGLDGGDEITARMDNGLLEFGTVSYFDKHELMTMDHDVSDLVPAAHILEFTREAENLRNGIMLVIEPSVWHPELGAIAVNGSQLSVRAPKRIQAQIIDYIERLRSLEGRRSAEQARAAEKAIAEAEQLRETQIKNLHQHQEETLVEIEEIRVRRERLNIQFWDREYAIYELEEQYKLAEPGDHKSETRDRLVHAQAEHEALDEQRNDLAHQLSALQERLRILRNNIVMNSENFHQAQASGRRGR
jgi:hypothetical protein